MLDNNIKNSEISDSDLLLKMSKKIVKKVYIEDNKLTDYASGDLIYPFTNENLFEYYNKNLENKRVISVTSSGDHILHAALAGAKEIIGFDINRFCKYYCALKIAMIKTYNINEFESLIHDFVSGKVFITKKILKDVKKYLTKNEIIFWNTYFEIISKKYDFNIFTSDGALLYNNDYLDIDDDSYEVLQDRLSKCNITYIDSGIDKLKQLKEKVDVIYLSNILAITNNPEFNCNFLKEIECLLNQGAIIYEYCFEKVDWHLDDYEKFDIKKLKALEEKLSFYTIESEEYESFSYSNGRVYKYIKR